MPYVKNILFTFIAVFLIPLLFFVLLEFSLKLFGVGTSFQLFQEIEINGRVYFQENPHFAEQFYPASLEIAPLETTFAEERGADVVRVYVLGGSAAMGFPHKNHGLDRHLATLLGAALPARKIEIVNTAMTSVNSHVVYEVARSIPEDSGDFAIILMGNNEVVGPYGPGTFNQNFLSNLTLIRGLQALKRTRIWQALQGVIQQASPDDAREDLKWQGMQMFTDYGVSRDDPRMETVYGHYETNLKDIIAELQGKGLQVILSSVPVNLRHSAPFLSLQNPGLSQQQLAEWRELDRRGAESFNRENWGEAIASFRAALEIDPGYADHHFRLGTAYEHLDQFDQAGTHYERALDLDALRFRADTRINQIVRDVADTGQYEGLSFVDSVAAFEQESQPFQPGWNLLLEHVHYGFSGNYLLAEELSRSIVSQLAPDGDFEPLPPTDVAERMGFPNHETIDVMKNLQGMIENPPFPGQSNYAELVSFVNGKIDSVTEEVGSPADVIRRRQEVVDAQLADWKVHYELAELNRFLRNRRAMYNHLEQLFKLYPHNRESYMKMAELKSKDGKWSEAIPYLEQSLYYTRGDETLIVESIGMLGLAYFRTGEYDGATELLLEIPGEYSEQIGATLRAYGTLVKYSREAGKNADTARYVEDVERYARSLLQRGKDKEYPLLYQRMAQIMTLAGSEAEAKKWKGKPGK